MKFHKNMGLRAFTGNTKGVGTIYQSQLQKGSHTWDFIVYTKKLEGKRGREKMPVARAESSGARVIAHVDMDCFYVQGFFNSSSISSSQSLAFCAGICMCSGQSISDVSCFVSESTQPVCVYLFIEYCLYFLLSISSNY